MSDNPFPDTPKDIERRARYKELSLLRETAWALEQAAIKLAEDITKLEDELEEKWEQEDDAQRVEDIPSLIRKHRRKNR